MRATVLACALIAALDIAQPVLMSWRPKFVGSIAGALLYTALALMIATGRGRKLALWVTSVMPLIPSITIIATWFGARFPVDVAMQIVLCVQLFAAASAQRVLRRPLGSQGAD